MEEKKKAKFRQSLGSVTTRRISLSSSSFAGCGARCICNEGMRVSDNRAASHPARRARCIKSPGGCIGCRARDLAAARALLLSSPGHWNAIPRADDLYLASARPRGRMSHVPSLCLYRSSRKYPAAREQINEHGLTSTFIRATIIVALRGSKRASAYRKNGGIYNTDSSIYVSSRDNSKRFDNLRLLIEHYFICVYEIF